MEYIEKFTKKICEKYPDAEITKILAENADCGYYELCQSFLDIALNAQKFKAEDGTLQGVFQYSDIDIAKAKAIDFIKNNNVTDLDSFFKILDYAYPQSVSTNDKRPKTAFIREENCKYVGYFGTLYTLTHISSSVYQKIANELIEEITAI